MADFGWSYPPGVTGREPEITGEWGCLACDGEGGERDEDGRGHACSRCSGTGIDPEEFRLFYVEELAQNGPHVAADVASTVLDWVRNHRWNRADADDRRMLRAAARLLKAQRS